MANVSLHRPDLEAYRNLLILPMPELLSTLISTIGKKLPAFVAGVDDTEMIDSWIAGEPSRSDARLTSLSPSLVDGIEP